MVTYMPVWQEASTVMCNICPEIFCICLCHPNKNDLLTYLLTKDGICNSCDVGFLISSYWWSLILLQIRFMRQYLTSSQTIIFHLWPSEQIFNVMMVNCGEIGFVSMGRVCTHLTWCQLSNTSCNESSFFLVEQSFPFWSWKYEETVEKHLVHIYPGWNCRICNTIYNPCKSTNDLRFNNGFCP